MTSKFRISRRGVLAGTAARAGASTLPRSARAQSKGKIVVGTWGGDYARLLNCSRVGIRLARFRSAQA